MQIPLILSDNLNEASLSKYTLDTFIIVAENVTTLCAHLSSNWTLPRSVNYILTFTGNSSTNKCMTDIFWNKNKIVSVVLAREIQEIVDAKTSGVMDVEVYNPFPFKGAGRGITLSVKFDWARGLKAIVNRILQNLHMFPVTIALEKDYNDYYQCKEHKTGYCGTGYWTSLLFQGISNCSIVFLPFTRSTRNDVLVLLRNRSIDAVLSPSLSTPKCTKGFEILNHLSFYSDEIVLVPKSDPYPKWMAVCLCLHWKIWASILTVFVGCVTVGYKNVGLVGLVCIFSSAGWSKLQDVKKISGRLLVTFCEFFSIIIISSLASSLYQKLLAPGYYHQIDSLASLDSSNLPIFSNTADSMLDLIDSQAARNLAYKLRNTRTSIIALLQQIGIYKNNSVIFDSFLIHVILKNLPRTVFQVHELDIIVGRSYRSYFLQADSLFTDRLNKITSTIRESGLLAFWNRLFVDKLTSIVSFFGYGRDKLENKKVAFNITDLAVAFYVLIIGEIVSLVVFIIELTLARIKYRRYMREVQLIKLKVGLKHN